MAGVFENIEDSESYLGESKFKEKKIASQRPVFWVPDNFCK